jgi:FixJ family two-component response regulator
MDACSHVLKVLDSGLISIVDDDESIRDATKTLLRSAGYEVRTFASAEEFLDSGPLQATDCLILDVRMPAMSGLVLQELLNTEASRLPIIFVTAHDDQASRRKAIDAGATDFFRKPFSGDVLLGAIQIAISGRRRVRA